MSSNPVEQICEFGNITVAGEQYYGCTINNTKLIQESMQIVTTNTKSNLKSNEDVELIVYKEMNFMNFIPNSIFAIFPNVECFLIMGNQLKCKLEPHFLKGAKNLKIFHIEGGKMDTLDANLFVEAPNLEIINLYCNQIKSIDRWTFSGLRKLQYIYLVRNPLKYLHPKTFSHLKNLNNLHMTNSTINKEFVDFKDFQEIEEQISMNCQFDDDKDDSVSLNKVEEDESDLVVSFKKLIFVDTQLIFDSNEENL